MDTVDRDLERAEYEATRGHSLRSAQSSTRRNANSVYASSSSSRSSLSTDSTASTRPDIQPTPSVGASANININQNTLEKRRTRPLELYRSQTHRLQHTHTVAADLTRTSTAQKPLPRFGGGKPYPPDLPAQEEYVVEFDGQDDPLHPMNWSLARKLNISVILAYTSLCSTFTSSVFSASTQAVAQEFNVSVTVATLSTSLYVLGYAFGPILWSPLSELRGRRLPLNVGMFGFSVFNLAVAVSKDLQTLMISRFFSGLFGSCPLALVAAVYSDIYDSQQRGPAVTIFSCTVFMGPMLGPFIGGFIVTGADWRWTAYLSSIIGWLSFALILVCLRETYPSVVLVSKAAELRRRTKNWGIHAKQEEVEVDFHELMVKNFSRPFRLLFTEPAILLISIYMSFIYGLLYLFLTSYPIVFQGIHGMAPGPGGLPFFGMVVGLLMVTTYLIWIARSYNKRMAANGGTAVPEWRLPPVVLGGAVFAAGLFWFGWTGFTSRIHWIVPTLSGIFTGFGIMAIFVQSFNYIIDSYLMFAASAIAGNTFLRSITGAGFPLFARQMFEGLGVQWASTLVGCVAVLLVPIPLAFHHWGSKLREKSRFSPTFAEKKVPDDDSDEGEAEASLENKGGDATAKDVEKGLDRTRSSPSN